MGDSAYTTPEPSDNAMALIRNMVLLIRRQNGKAVQCIWLPTPTALPACEENIGMKKEGRVAFDAWHDSDESERWPSSVRLGSIPEVMRPMLPSSELNAPHLE